MEGDAVLLEWRPGALLEYGVQCLPLASKNAKTGPSRIKDIARIGCESPGAKAAMSGKSAGYGVFASA